MDGTFHAIATILHRVPRDAGNPRGKRKGGSTALRDRPSDPRDVPDGWIRVAL